MENSFPEHTTSSESLQINFPAELPTTRSYTEWNQSRTGLNFRV